jgi:hypothetical protein
MRLSRLVLALAIIVASAAVFTPGCGTQYAEVYSCTDYIRERETSWGSPDPCCELEPLCVPATIANLAVCNCRQNSCTAGTKLKMECSSDAMGTMCECFQDDVSLGSCQEVGDFICSVLASCCSALFFRSTS